MTPLRYAVSIESDLKFLCDQQGILLRDCFIGKDLLWQFSVLKKVYVRYWPARELCLTAQIHTGKFEWRSVSKCQITRVMQYAMDHAAQVRRWVNARTVQDRPDVERPTDPALGVDGIPPHGANGEA